MKVFQYILRPPPVVSAHKRSILRALELLGCPNNTYAQQSNSDLNHSSSTSLSSEPITPLLSTKRTTGSSSFAKLPRFSFDDSDACPIVTNAKPGPSNLPEITCHFRSLSDSSLYESMAFSEVFALISDTSTSLHWSNSTDQQFVYLSQYNCDNVFIIPISSNTLLFPLFLNLFTLPLLVFDLSILCKDLTRNLSPFECEELSFILAKSTIIDLSIIHFHCPIKISNIQDLLESSDQSYYPHLSVCVGLWTFLSDLLSSFPNNSETDQQFNILCEVPVTLTSGIINFIHLTIEGASQLPRLSNSLLLDLLISPIFAAMSCRGITFDPRELENKSFLIENKLEELTRRASSLAGKPFLLSSPQEVADILYLKLKLTPDNAPYTTFNTASTCAKVLHKLKDSHPIVPIILEHRELFKLYTGHLSPLCEQTRNSKGLIHSIFSLTVTETGRIASSAPNVQNLPSNIYTINNENFSIRSAFKARTGKVFVSLDFCHVELRCLALLTKDSSLASHLNSSNDLYTTIAASFLNKSIDSITINERTTAKRLCYAIVYGASPASLSDELNVSIPEAVKLINDFCSTVCPSIKPFTNKIVAESINRNPPSVILPDGRVRVLNDLKHPKPTEQRKAVRQAVNTLVQGFASFLVKKAFLNCLLTSQDFDVVPVLHIHDEILFEVSEFEAEKLANILKTNLQDALNNDFVNFPVSAKIGPNFGELTAI
ncbi:hypothetical protein RCL1_003020 [Eukaryota sp. TZLM3-RCL]